MVLDGGTWDDELALWSEHPDRWTQASYTRLNEMGKGPRGGNVPIAGRAKPEFRGPWDNIVVDEAHYTKNRGTNWTETVENLANRASGLTLELTGTPISHWAPDLYTILRVLHPEEAKRGRRFGSYWRWIEEWFDVQPSRFGGPNARVVGDLLECNSACLRRPPHDPCQHYIDFMRSNMGDQFLRRLRDDCLDLPPLIGPQRIDTPMTGEQLRMYRDLKRDFATHTDDADFEAWSDGARVTMMSKLTTSPWLLTKKGPPRGGKFEQLREDLRNRTRPTFALAHYRDSVEAISAVGADLGLSSEFIHGGTSRDERRRIVSAFKSGRLDLLSGSLEVVAEGLTLTQADMAIFVEKSWKPSRNTQARDRIYRMGQSRPVTVREYITPQSLDSAKTKVLDTKTDRQIRMMSAGQFLELM